MGKRATQSGKRERKAAARVAVLSDHPLVLIHLRRALAGKRVQVDEVRFESAQPAGGGSASIPEATVFVVDAAGRAGVGPKAVESILQQRPGAMVLVAAERFSEDSAFDFLRLGARGLLTYAELEPQAARAVEALAAGNFWVPRALLGRFVDSILSGQNARAATAAEFKLSAREQQVLDALLDNLANKEIAARLNISERTVKFHVSHLLSKFNVQRRADLIVLFYQTRKSIP